MERTTDRSASANNSSLDSCLIGFDACQGPSPGCYSWLWTFRSGTEPFLRWSNADLEIGMLH